MPGNEPATPVDYGEVAAAIMHVMMTQKGDEWTEQQPETVWDDLYGELKGRVNGATGMWQIVGAAAQAFVEHTRTRQGLVWGETHDWILALEEYAGHHVYALLLDDGASLHRMIEPDYFNQAVDDALTNAEEPVRGDT